MRKAARSSNELASGLTVFLIVRFESLFEAVHEVARDLTQLTCKFI